MDSRHKNKNVTWVVVNPREPARRKRFSYGRLTSALGVRKKEKQSLLSLTPRCRGLTLPSFLHRWDQWTTKKQKRLSLSAGGWLGTGFAFNFLVLRNKNSCIDNQERAASCTKLYVRGWTVEGNCYWTEMDTSTHYNSNTENLIS